MACSTTRHEIKIGFSLIIPYDTFLTFISERHGDQFDNGGRPYIEHLQAVAAYTEEIITGLPEGLVSAEDRALAVLVALGHDLLEDGKGTEDDIRNLGGDDRLIRCLNTLDRNKNKSTTYFKWVANDIAGGDDIIPIIVKLADNRHNNLPERISQLPPEKQSITKRYDRAREVLMNGLQRHVETFLSSSLKLKP